MDVNANAVTQVMQVHKVSRLIHGHTHRPGAHDVDLGGKMPGKRIVLADWYDSASVLMYDESGARHCNLNDL